MGFFEIFIVLIIAIIFLGPDKLPQALIDLAKFFKAVKKTLDDAKTSIDREINLEDLKKEALSYKNALNQSLNQDINISEEIKELDRIIMAKDDPPSPIQSQSPTPDPSQSASTQAENISYRSKDS